MFNPGDIISYIDMCREEGVNLQRGMNYKLRNGFSVILMSLRKGAPYADRIDENGSILVYEGHDIPNSDNAIDPKQVDQQMFNPTGTLTQNGLFYEAAIKLKNGECEAEIVKVYEKIHSGIWAYNGLFKLVDSWQEASNGRKVFKFKLEIINEPVNICILDLDHTRLIPSQIKLDVWKRDKGQCVKCGSRDNLHFDHIIPFSKGGSSLVSANIQLLCARHNLQKHDNIE